MKIYTKTGDKGETSLFGGQRVPKSDLRVDAYGTVDELNAVLGMVISELNDAELKVLFGSIQNELFALGSDLATPLEKDKKIKSVPRIDEAFILNLELLIDRYDEKLPALKNFILPGGSRAAALIHFARTVCRRAERKAVDLAAKVDIGDYIVVYLNRLSDLLFVLARYENSVSGNKDITWNK